MWSMDSFKTKQLNDLVRALDCRVVLEQQKPFTATVSDSPSESLTSDCLKQDLGDAVGSCESEEGY